MTESLAGSVVSDSLRVEVVPPGEAEHEPLLCPSCDGVIVGAPAAALTPARGRLIVANGYCRGDCSGDTPTGR